MLPQAKTETQPMSETNVERTLCSPIRHSRQVKTNSHEHSFPRSAWECIWDALRRLCSYLGRPIQRTQSVQDAFPRRAWERVGLLNLTAMAHTPHS